jgi:hypothetical protein
MRWRTEPMARRMAASMSALRILVAWILLAALPLQGLAAASMLACGQASHAALAQDAGHDHAAHGDAAVDPAHMGSPHDQHHAAGGGGDGDGSSDAHGCPVCAACNLVALYAAPTLGTQAIPPAVPAADGPVRVATRVEPKPDKPPRA